MSSSLLFLQALGLSFLLTNPLLSRNRKIKQKLRALAESILLSKNKNGLWRYRADLPEDFDTTSLFLFILSRAKKIDPITLARFITILKNHRHDSGAFYTWVNVPKAQNELDRGVNLSILLLLEELGVRDIRLEQSLFQTPSLYYSASFLTLLERRKLSLPESPHFYTKNIFIDKDVSTGRQIWIHSPFVEHCLHIRRKADKTALRMNAKNRKHFLRKFEEIINTEFAEDILSFSKRYQDHTHELTRFLCLLPKLEKSHGIVRARLELFLKTKQGGLHTECLGALYGWTAFTLINSQIDNNISDLTPYIYVDLINKSIACFTRAGISINETCRAFSTSSAFSYFDTDRCDKKPTDLIHIAWKKSFAQTIGLFPEQSTKHIRFWKKYTLMKQLSDDLHDIPEDIQNKKQTLPSLVYLHVLKKISKKNNDRALYLTIKYFSRVLSQLCTDSLREYYDMPIESRSAFWRREIERLSMNSKSAAVEFVKLILLRKETEKCRGVN